MSFNNSALNYVSKCFKHVSTQKSSAQMFTAALIIIPKSGDNTNAHQMNIGLMKFGLFLQ